MPVKSSTGNDKAKWIAIGVAAAALAAGAALYFLQSRGSEDDSDDESEDAEEKPTTTEAKPVAESKPEKAPKLSKQHLLEILDALFSKTEELHKLVKDKLETQVADPSTLQKELETGMQQIEQQVHEKYDVDQQGLMLARQYYQDDPEVQAQILRLKKLFSPPDSDASLEDFMPKLRTHLDRSFDNVQQAYDRVVEEGLQGEAAMTKMLEYAQEDAQKVQDESLKEIGMSEEDFTAACLKFQGHPEVMSLFQQVMQKQAALQLKLMGQA